MKNPNFREEADSMSREESPSSSVLDDAQKAIENSISVIDMKNVPCDGKTDLLWVHQSVKLGSGPCQDGQPSSSEKCYMFSNLKPKQIDKH